MSAMRLSPRRFVVAALLSVSLLAGCDDSESSGGKDSGEDEEDSGAGDRDSGSDHRDAGGDTGTGEDPDSGEEMDAGTDGGDVDAGPEAEPLSEVFQGKKPLSADQADRFWVAKFGPDGKIYAAGFLTEAVSDTVLDRKFAVARLDTAGALDTTFGEDGIATVNVVAATSASDDEAVKGLSFQEDGKIIIAGTVETGKVSRTLDLPDGGTVGPTDYAELDVAVARLTTEGDLDETFSADDADGKPGILQFSNGEVIVALNNAGTAGSAANDDVGDVQVDGEDRIVLFSRGRAAPARTDTDRIIARFLKDGAPDTDFGTDGRFVFSTEPDKNNENAKGGVILEGNEILSSGYTNISSEGGNNIVLVRLNAAGDPVGTFDEDGALVVNPFKDDGGFVEAYGAARQSNGSFVTTGYGRAASSDSANTLLSCRFSSTGELDDSWGEAKGCFQLDVLEGASAASVGAEQGRNVVALPDDRIVMVGNGTVTMGDVDGIVVVLAKDGGADSGFFEVGHKSYDFGLPSDGLWGLDVSDDGKYVVAAGYAGHPNSASAEDRAQEDAALVIYKIGD